MLKQVALAKRGDPEAFQALMQSEKQKLYRIAFLYTHNEHDALEIFQETVYQAFRSIATLHNDNYFSTWLTRILINQAQAWLRKQQRMVPVSPDILQHTQLNSSVSIEPEVHMDLIQALGQLEETYRTVLILRYYRDYTIPQIADILDCPRGTVKTNIKRGLERLRIVLKGVYQDESATSLFQAGDR
ncbi:sigma-70 family RNA polymerase sigma factor [Paenibacillus kandeliae]|uniref:sigma-70 family RNA polymerase sigma factor n=1 Tax=Paenibacillus kandeliae TaxID=3231269 RepID=UPI0034592968